MFNYDNFNSFTFSQVGDSPEYSLEEMHVFVW